MRNRIFDTTRPAPEAKAAATGTPERPYSVALPVHLYVPPGGQTIDIARAESIPLVGAFDFPNFISFTCPQGGVAQILGYAIYTTIADYNNIEFTPFQNNSRVFPFHGNPQDSFRIRFTPSLSLGNDSIRNTQLTLKPNEILRWRINGVTAAANEQIGIRVIGFFTTQVENLTQRFGG